MPGTPPHPAASHKMWSHAHRKAADGMAVDHSEAFCSEDEAPEGPLDYGQNYPTMLPFLPPDQEAALQVCAGGVRCAMCCCAPAQVGCLYKAVTRVVDWPAWSSCVPCWQATCGTRW